jgi:4-azaleucine resistance transporter AzlC
MCGMLEPATDASRCSPSRWARFARGVRLGLPILLGYAPVGATFGVLARKTGFSSLQAVVCSATALAGAGQFIALSVLAAGGGVLAVLAATTVVNLRYVLFGATVAPLFGRAAGALRPLLAFTLTDETFAVNTTDARTSGADPVSALGVGAIAWVGWVGGTALGALASASIPDPTRFGAEFAMPAMFTALLVGQIESRSHAVAAAIAAVLALASAALLPGTWGITVGAVVGAAIAAWWFR